MTSFLSHVECIRDEAQTTPSGRESDALKKPCIEAGTARPRSALYRRRELANDDGQPRDPGSPRETGSQADGLARAGADVVGRTNAPDFRLRLHKHAFPPLTPIDPGS
jgi:hypothetical protein